MTFQVNSFNFESFKKLFSSFGFINGIMKKQNKKKKRNDNETKTKNSKS